MFSMGLSGDAGNGVVAPVVIDTTIIMTVTGLFDVIIQEARRGRIGRFHLFALVPGRFQLPLDIQSELLAEFHSPLIKAINVPDKALDRRPVLVQGQELTTGVGREFGQEQTQTRPVPLEHLVTGQSRGHAFGPDFVHRLARGQGVGLGKEIRHELVVRTQTLTIQLIVVLTLDKTNKLAGHRLTHVQQLVKGMLTIRAGCNNRTRW